MLLLNLVSSLAAAYKWLNTLLPAFHPALGRSNRLTTYLLKPQALSVERGNCGCLVTSQRCVCRQEEAWESEFWPACCAEAILQLLRQLAHKACWLPEGEDRRLYAATVPLVCHLPFCVLFETCLSIVQWWELKERPVGMIEGTRMTTAPWDSSHTLSYSSSMASVSALQYVNVEICMKFPVQLHIYLIQLILY